MEVVGRNALGRASAPFRTDQQPLSDRGTASSGTPTGRGPRLTGTPFGGGAADACFERAEREAVNCGRHAVGPPAAIDREALDRRSG